ncbi:MAG: hypothetical protein IIY72_00145, partial [Solobacterium sp.]|nr:hypothetical protein [Solobacterium sp.]
MSVSLAPALFSVTINCSKSGPNARIQYISQNACIPGNGQELKGFAALGDLHHQDLPAIVIKVVPRPQSLQGIVAAAFYILVNILIGIDQIDKFPKEKSHLPQLRCPPVFFPDKYLRQHP